MDCNNITDTEIHKFARELNSKAKLTEGKPQTLISDNQMFNLSSSHDFDGNRESLMKDYFEQI